MSELVRLYQVLKKLAEGLDYECTERSDSVELERDCALVEAAFQDDTVDFNWLLHSDDVQDFVVRAVISLVQRTRLPQRLTNENEDLHFKETARLTAVLASSATVILSNVDKGSRSLDDADERTEGARRLVREVVSAVAPQCLVLIATHSEKQPWTSKSSRQACQGLSEILCKMCDCDSVPTLLVGRHEWGQGPRDGGLFGDVLGLLRERLTRADWHKEPGTKQAFTWCLLQMKQPLLGDHLDAVLPPSLLFTDDYKINNKLLGLKCLQHIIDNVAPTELRLYGRAVVIYEALHHHLFTPKAALLGQFLPCMIRILAVIERSPHKADQQRKPNRYDTVLQTVLTSMEFEQKFALRRAYAKNLHLFIDSMGVTILRHMKTVMRVIVKYLDTSEGMDDISTVCMLQSLHSLILQAWPRIPSHWECIMKVLLKLLYEVCDNSSSQSNNEVRQSMADACVDCLVLLRRCCQEITEEALKDILTIQTAEFALMKQCVERVLAS